MKLSVFNPVLYSLSLEDALKYLQRLGVQAMELGCGGYPGTTHANAEELVKSPAKVKELKKLFTQYGIAVSALSVHGNGVHPDKAFAASSTAVFRAACQIAGDLGTDRVVTFSGCPGDGKSEQPNWITCTWPPEFYKTLEYQWNDILIPYWQKEGEFAEKHGIKVALEMHPGFCVYNAPTMLRLRKAAGDAIGANLDPSHLIWQGADIVSVVKALADAIHFFHCKDTAINRDIKMCEGVLDTKPYARELDRAWLFRTVGYGDCDWKGVISALRMVGYDHALSIEHEDSLMPPVEGLEKAVKYLQSIMIYDAAGTEAWW